VRMHPAAGHARQAELGRGTLTLQAIPCILTCMLPSTGDEYECEPDHKLLYLAAVSCWESLLIAA